MFASVRRTSHASTQLAYTAAYSASVADATMTGMRVDNVRMGWLKAVAFGDCRGSDILRQRYRSLGGKGMKRPSVLVGA